MDDITITQEEYDGLQETAVKLETAETRVVELETSVEEGKTAATDAATKISQLEEKVVKLEADEVDDEEDQLPENIKVMLETQQAEINRLKGKTLVAEVSEVINRAEAYRDESGRGHSPVLLNAAQNVLLGKDVVVKDTTVIKLEGETAVAVVKYTKNVMEYLLENLPGQVLFAPGDDIVDDNPIPADADANLLEEGASLWNHAV